MEDVKKFSQVDPDDLHFSSYDSITFFYLPESRELFYDKWPKTHDEMIYRNDLFTALFPGINPTHSNKYRFSSRKWAIQKGAILGRFGLYEDRMVISLWNPNLNQPELINLISTLNDKFPETKDAILVQPQKPPIVLGNLKTFSKNQPEKHVVFGIGNSKYKLNDLAKMRNDLHIKAGNKDAELNVLCNPDLEKYPELKGFRPALCPGDNNTLRKNHPNNWRQAALKANIPYVYKYGETYFHKKER
jgi:hypothetical protein